MTEGGEDERKRKAERVSREIGQRVFELRLERGLTQQELGERLFTDAREVRRLESGGNVTLHKLVYLADALGVPIADFFSKPKLQKKRARGRPKIER